MKPPPETSGRAENSDRDHLAHLRSAERRRWLRGGLAAGSVVMTVASRPVLAQACFAPSAMGSMPASGNRPVQVCTGLTPEEWRAVATQWPSPYLGAVAGTAAAASVDSSTTTAASTTDSTTSTTSRRRQPGETLTTQSLADTTSTSTQTSTSTGGYGQPTLFHCPTTGLGGRVFGRRSMLDVIDLTDVGIYSLGRYVVAALLNARAGRTPVLSETGVRNMWNDLVNRGYYEPTAGAKWTANEIVTYLQTTMS
jgi:hypothetical protein